MNNLQVIKLALDYIDKNLQETITYDSLARQFHYSPFHFNRIFTAVLGRTITEYVRNRRLEHALVMLSETNESVLNICFACGFESMQTFCRVFKNQYKLTPSAYKKSGRRVTLTGTDIIIKNYKKTLSGGIFMTPKFVSKDSFKLIGCERYTGNGWHVIGETWDELKKRGGEIKNTVNEHLSYGFEDYSKDFIQSPLQFYYMAGVEVSSIDEIPHGMVSKEIPACEYAVFTVKGNNSNGEIGKAFRYIYDEWLPNSDYVLASEICGDFELYDERWKHDSPEGEMDIYLPVLKK